MTTTALRFDSRRGHGTGARATLRRVLADGVRILALWQARHSQRRDLAELTADRLADIGVSAADAAAEARKPFWQA